MHPVEKVEALRACCCIAGADGETTADERKILERIAGEVGVGQASLEAMIWQAENEPDFYKEQFRILKGNPSEVMIMLMQVAAADRTLSAEETEMARKLSVNLSVSNEVFENLVTRVNAKLDR